MNAREALLFVTNQTQRTVLCPRVTIADTGLKRLIGLLGRPPLEPTEGILIKPSSGVHTWGMSFAIDVVALSRDNRVLGLWHRLGPWKVCGLSLKTRSILELAPGSIDKSRTRIGDQLYLSPADA
jgi:uncharacterized membrane protein (UPF0127 family)